jgi:hypothetical protein
MANTIRPYTGDGTTVLYPVDFDLGYIRKSHIYVYLEGDDHTVQLDYTYISDVQIQLVTPVANGTVFNIRRVVPRDSLVNDYEDGAALHEGNLDNSFKQALMVQEELSDGFANLDGSFNVLADLDLLDTHKVINSVDPVDGGDLVNLSYMNTHVEQEVQIQASISQDGWEAADDVQTAQLQGYTDASIGTLDTTLRQELVPIAGNVTMTGSLGGIHANTPKHFMPQEQVAVAIDNAIKAYAGVLPETDPEDWGFISQVVTETADYGGLT